MKISQILPKTKVAGVAPYFELLESDQVLPAGMYRWRIQADVAVLERALAVDWSSVREVLSISSTGEVTLATAKIAGVADPTADQEAATKKYVDDAVLTMNEFLELTDTPSAFTGEGGKVVAVNSTPDALEFVAITSFAEVTFLGDFEGGVMSGMSNLNDHLDTDFDGGEMS